MLDSPWKIEYDTDTSQISRVTSLSLGLPPWEHKWIMVETSKTESFEPGTIIDLYK